MWKMMNDFWLDIKDIAANTWERRRYYKMDEMIIEIWSLLVCLLFAWCFYANAVRGDLSSTMIFGFATLIQFLITVINCMARLRFHEMRLKEEENRIQQESLLEVELGKRGKIDTQEFIDLKEKLFVSGIARRLVNMDAGNRVISNVLLPRTNTSTSQIDVLLINANGIFILELKNMTGYISGDGNTGNWKARYHNGVEYEVPNAIQQNSGHYDCLRKLLGRQEKRLYKNIVVLGDFCRYDISNVPAWANVIQGKQLERKVMHLASYSCGVLSPEEVESYYTQLKPYENPTPESLQDHIERVQTQ